MDYRLSETTDTGRSQSSLRARSSAALHSPHEADLEVKLDHFRRSSARAEREIREIEAMWKGEIWENRGLQDLLERTGYEGVDARDREAVLRRLYEVAVGLKAARMKEREKDGELRAEREKTQAIAIENLDLKAGIEDMKARQQALQEANFLLEKKLKWWKDKASPQMSASKSTLQTQLTSIKKDLETTKAHLKELQPASSERLLTTLEKVYGVTGEAELCRAAKAQAALERQLVAVMADMQCGVMSEDMKQGVTLQEACTQLRSKIRELQHAASDFAHLSSTLKNYCHLSPEASLSEVVSSTQLVAVRAMAEFMDEAASVLHSSPPGEVNRTGYGGRTKPAR